MEVDLEHLRRLLVGEVRTFQTEKRYLHQDGHVVWALLSVSVVHDEEDEPLYFVSQIQDVTERKKVEKVIKESEERFRSLVQNSSDIITILGADGTVHCNPAVQRVTGYKPEEKVGTNAFGSVHPEDREQALNTFAELLKTWTSPALGFRVPHKDGSWRYLEHVVNNLLDHPPVRGVVINSRTSPNAKPWRATQLSGVPRSAHRAAEPGAVYGSPRTRLRPCVSAGQQGRGAVHGPGQLQGHK